VEGSELTLPRRVLQGQRLADHGQRLLRRLQRARLLGALGWRQFVVGMVGEQVLGQVLAHRKGLGTVGHRAGEVAPLHVALHVLLQQRLLIEAARADVALELELVVHLEVLVEVRLLQELLVALVALVRKGQAVGLHVRVQLRLQLEVLLRTAGTVVAGDPGVRLQVLVQRGHLRELLVAHVAAVLLHLVVRLHVVVQIRHLQQSAFIIIYF